MRTDHTDTPAGCEYGTVYIAFELSKAKWQLGIMLPGGEKMSRYRIDGGDLAALSELRCSPVHLTPKSRSQSRMAPNSELNALSPPRISLRSSGPHLLRSAMSPRR